jgi:hypothetical protein
MTEQELRERIAEIVKNVARENPDYRHDHDKLWRAVIAELSFWAKVGYLRFEGKRIKRVTGVETEDFYLAYLYTDIERDDEQGLFGYGYAYNLTDPDLSEAGYLFTPRRVEDWKEEAL